MRTGAVFSRGAAKACISPATSRVVSRAATSKREEKAAAPVVDRRHLVSVALMTPLIATVAHAGDEQAELEEKLRRGSRTSKGDATGSSDPGFSVSRPSDDKNQPSGDLRMSNSDRLTEFKSKMDRVRSGEEDPAF